MLVCIGTCYKLYSKTNEPKKKKPKLVAVVFCLENWINIRKKNKLRMNMDDRRAEKRKLWFFIWKICLGNASCTRHSRPKWCNIFNGNSVATMKCVKEKCLFITFLLRIIAKCFRIYLVRCGSVRFGAARLLWLPFNMTSNELKRYDRICNIGT